MFLFFLACTVVSRGQAAIDPNANSGSAADPPKATAPFELRKGMNEFGVWGGGAFSATTIFGGLHADEAAGRKYFTIGLRYGRVLAAKKRAALEYTLDAIPVAVAFHTIVRNPTPPPTTIRQNAYGWGVTPLGLKATFGSGKVKEFASVAGGLLWFNKSVPRPDAGRFAFTGEADGGVEVLTESNRAVILGVKFHHISNANLSGANRGLNQFIFYVGYSVFK